MRGQHGRRRGERHGRLSARLPGPRGHRRRVPHQQTRSRRSPEVVRAPYESSDLEHELGVHCRIGRPESRRCRDRMKDQPSSSQERDRAQPRVRVPPRLCMRVRRDANDRANPPAGRQPLLFYIAEYGFSIAGGQQSRRDPFERGPKTNHGNAPSAESSSMGAILAISSREALSTSRPAGSIRNSRRALAAALGARFRHTRRQKALTLKAIERCVDRPTRDRTTGSPRDLIPHPNRVRVVAQSHHSKEHQSLEFT